MALVFLLYYWDKIELFCCVCVCACGEFVVGMEVGFLVHVHVWAAEYEFKHQNHYIFPLQQYYKALKEIHLSHGAYSQEYGNRRWTG